MAEGQGCYLLSSDGGDKCVCFLCLLLWLYCKVKSGHAENRKKQTFSGCDTLTHKRPTKEAQTLIGRLSPSTTALARIKTCALRQHGIAGKGLDLVNHELEVSRDKGLDLRHRVLGAVVESVVKDAGGGNAAGALHGVTDGSGVGEVGEFLAEVHELDE